VVSASEDGTLRRIPLFAELSDSELKVLEDACVWRRFHAHEQIIDREDDSRDVFFITRGEVRVVNYSMSGREVSFDEIEAGYFFGELAALDGAPRSASVVALMDTTVALMPPEVLQQLVVDHPQVGLQLMARMAHIIRTSTSRIMDLSTLGANNRVYAELLRMARQNLKGDETARISPIPIHGDIASRVSTTRETVARVLSDLSRQGLVVRQGNALVIKDVPRLTEMVEHFRGA
jgi:CRP-like cAMP-binding protein